MALKKIKGLPHMLEGDYYLRNRPQAAKIPMLLQVCLFLIELYTIRARSAKLLR